MDPGETPQQAAIRELMEETGIQTDAPIYDIGALYCSRPGINFPFHMFKLTLTREPLVKLSEEHTEHIWVTPTKSKSLDLISGGSRVVDEYLLHCSKSK